jgi:carboxynorspermidine decarboxylase
MVMQPPPEVRRVPRQKGSVASACEGDRHGVIDQVATPAFVYDESEILARVRHVRAAADSCGCRLLYSIKPFLIPDALKLLVGQIDGFAVSSAFEAQLAREILGSKGSVHFFSPGLRKQDLQIVREACEYITFNSISQYSRLASQMGSTVKCGIRVNPQLSFLSDDRYDPCRRESKLGVPLPSFVHAAATNQSLAPNLSGIHFHTNCESENLEQLYSTAQRVMDGLSPAVLKNIRWVNMGGGYLFSPHQDLNPFFRAVEFVKRRGIEVFIEPGAALVRTAARLIATVVDLFSVGRKSFAVLDTTVNHLPEVFEYQFEPDVMGDSDNGPYEYTLAGSSCLAGDLFGEYSFAAPLSIGSRVVFENVGAYSLVKANMFNGINLPTVYAHTPQGDVIMKKQFDYSDFVSRSR